MYLIFVPPFCFILTSTPIVAMVTARSGSIQSSAPLPVFFSSISITRHTRTIRHRTATHMLTVFSTPLFYCLYLGPTCFLLYFTTHIFTDIYTHPPVFSHTLIRLSPPTTVSTNTMCFCPLLSGYTTLVFSPTNI